MSINLVLLTDRTNRCCTFGQTCGVLATNNVARLILAFVVVLDVLLFLCHGIIVLFFIVFQDCQGCNICLCKIEGHLLFSNQKDVNLVATIVCFVMLSLY